MIRKSIIFLSTMFFILVGCQNPTTIPIPIDNAGSARVIQSFSDLPEASSNNDGYLYYVIDEDQFYYSDGSTYVAIDLTGPAGGDGQDGVDGIDATLPFQTVVVDIGPWDMSTQVNMNIYYSSFGVADLTQDRILSMEVIVHSDPDVTAGYWSYIDTVGGGYVQAADSYIRICSLPDGMFDSDMFDDITISRGKLIIDYVD